MIWSRFVNAIAARVEARLQRLLRPIGDDVRAIAGRQKQFEQTARSLATEQVALRMLLQRHGGAPAAAGEEREGDQGDQLAGPPVPLSVADAPAPRIFTSGRRLELTPITQCPACGGTERTLVCEYNKSVAIEIEIEEPMRRYDYSMCHACGLTYTTLRPMGETYTYLFSRFDESLGRELTGARKRNPLLSPLPLSEEERQTLKRRLERGALVSEHLELARDEFVPQLLTDRLANSGNLEILGSLLNLKRPRVLEIRARFGSIAAGLTRLYGAEAFAMSLTEAQGFVMKEAYGIEASALIDFENFRIPYDTKFDLIVAAHMFTHVLKPADFFSEIRKHLAPGGHLYLHKEPDDTDFLDGPMMMFNSMNPFHMQVFDRKAMVRALGALGFEPVFVGHHHGNLIMLAKEGTPVPPALGEKERRKRLSAYQRSRDAAILRLPEGERWRFAAEWQHVVERAVASGVAEFDEHARLRIVRKRSAGLAVSD